MNREKALVKNMFIIGIGTFFPKFASIITLPIVTAYLTKAEYGTYDLLLILISLVLPLATLQIQSAAFRFLVQNRSDKDKCIEIITNIVIFTLLASIIPIAAIYFAIGDYYGSFTRLIICLYFFFDIMLQTVQQIIRGLGKNITYSVSIVTNSLLNMAMIVLLVRIFRLGLSGVAASLVIANSITLFVVIMKEKISGFIIIKKTSRKTIKEMIGYSWTLIPNNLSSWVMTLSDRLLLAFFLGVEVNAVYAVAKKIPNLLTAVQSTFSLAWQENASLSSNDPDIDEYYSTMFDKVFNVVIGCCLMLIGFSPALFKILIRGDYDEAYYQMPILFLAFTFTILSAYLAGIYIADKRTREIGITTTIAAAINLLIDVIAIPLIGIWAASISTLISYIFLFVYRIYDLKKYHTIRYKKCKMLLVIVIVAGFCIVSFFNVSWLNIVLLFLGILVAFYLNSSILIAIMRNIISKLKK